MKFNYKPIAVWELKPDEKCVEYGMPELILNGWVVLFENGFGKRKYKKRLTKFYLTYSEIIALDKWIYWGTMPEGATQL